MPFLKTAEVRPHLFSGYLRTALLMGGLIALLGIGGRALGGTQGMLLFGGCPENLAAALAQQVEQGQQVRPYEFPGPATAHLFIVPPVRGAAPPPTEERIRLLQAMRA